MNGDQSRQKVLLLSIKPEYANKIFSGDKKIELRRTKPNVIKGDIVVIYVSSPVMTFSGQFKVEEVVQNSPDKLWFEVWDKAGITRREFDDYYRGSKLGYGIRFKEVKTFKQPITLLDLRKTWFDFTPPQIYRYLLEHEYKMVLPWKELAFFNLSRIKTRLLNSF